MNFDASFAVLISFATFVLLVGRKAYLKVLGDIDDKINKIRESLALSDNELTVAEQLNLEEHKRLTTVEEDVRVILEKTNEESARLKRKMLQEIGELTQARQAAFEDNLSRMRLQSMQLLRKNITKATMKSLEILSHSKVTQKQHEAINDTAIDLISSELSESKLSDSN